MECEACSIL